MPYIIGEPCIDVMDKSCIDECPVDCIYEGERMLYIHPTECIDCGACEPVCPMEAIVQDRKADENWLAFQDHARELFDGLGHTGGASRVSLPLVDPAPIRNHLKVG